MRHLCRAVLIAVLLSATQFVWTALPILECRQTPPLFAKQTPQQATVCKAMAWLVANGRSTAWAMGEPNDTPLDPRSLPGGNPKLVFSYARIMGLEEAVMLGIPSSQIAPGERLPTAPGTILFGKYDPLNQMGQITRFTVSEGVGIIHIKAVALTPQHASSRGPHIDADWYNYYDSVWSDDPNCQSQDAVNAYYPKNGVQALPRVKLQNINSGANPCMIPLGTSAYDRGDGLWHMTEIGFRTMMMFLGVEWHSHEMYYVFGNVVPFQNVSKSGNIFRTKVTIHEGADMTPQWYMASKYVDGIGMKNSGNWVGGGSVGVMGSRYVWDVVSKNGNFDFSTLRVYDHTTTQSSWGSIFVVLLSIVAIAALAAVAAVMLPGLVAAVGGTEAAAAIGAVVGAAGGLMTTGGNFSTNAGASTFVPFSDGSQSADALHLSGIMAKAQANMPSQWTDMLATDTPGAVGSMAARVDLRKLAQCIGTMEMGAGQDCTGMVETVDISDPRYRVIKKNIFYNSARRMIDEQRMAPNPDQETNPWAGVNVPVNK